MSKSFRPTACRFRCAAPRHARAQRGNALVVLMVLMLAIVVALWYATGRKTPRPPTPANAPAQEPVTPVEVARSITRSCDKPFPPAGLVRSTPGLAQRTATPSTTTFRNRTAVDRMLDLIADREVVANVAVPANAEASVDLPARSYHWQLRSGAAWCSDGRFAREVVVEMINPLDIVANSHLTIQIEVDPSQPAGVRLTASDAPVVRAAPVAEAAATARPVAGIVLQRSAGGHYFIDGAINGVATRFLVDTGASSVVLPAPLARQLGYYDGPQVVSNTANGTAVGYRFTVKTLAFGPFSVDDTTVIALPNVEVPLLGMSVLQSVDLQQTGRGQERRPRR
jgi:aspartyl protease family protein